MNWKHVSLGEISVNIQTGPFGSQLHQSDYSEKGTPVVMPKDLISGHISEESIARVSDDHVERLSRHKIEVGDILYSRRADVPLPVKLKQDGFVGQAVCALRLIAARQIQSLYSTNY